MVAVTDKVAKQINCSFVEDRTPVLCKTGPVSKEKAYGTPFLKISKRGATALGKLDFAINEAEGTFQRTIDLAPKQDWKPVAELVLTALYTAYGMRDPKAGLSLVADQDSLPNFSAVTACPGEYNSGPVPVVTHRCRSLTAAHHVHTVVHSVWSVWPSPVAMTALR